MARKTPVPQKELEIGRRLREFREKHLKMTRVRTARELGIHENRLESYEIGKVPMKFWFVEMIGQKLGLSQDWLFDGKKAIFPYVPYVPIDKSVADQAGVKSDELFSSAWPKVVPFIGPEQSALIMGALYPTDPPAKVDQKRLETRVFNGLLVSLKNTHEACPADLKLKLVHAMVAALVRFRTDHPKDFPPNVSFGLID